MWFIQLAVSGSSAAITNVGPEDLVCGMQLELPCHVFDVIYSCDVQLCHLSAVTVALTVTRSYQA
jgi:hypothetical protein